MVSRVFALFIVLLSAWVAWADITVYPLSIKLPVPPGGEATTGFWVENVGDKPADVRITLQDWWRDPEGKLQLLPPGTLEGSCAPWIVYSPNSLVLPPGGKARISVRIAVPKDGIGDRWALFLVAEFPPEREEEAHEEATGRTRVVVAYAVKFLRQDPQNASPAGEIRSVEVLSTSPLKLKILYVNTGNAHTVNRGTVEVRDIFGETVLSFPIEEFPTLPGEKRYIVAEAPENKSLPGGVYYAFVTIDFGGEYLVQGGTMVRVPSG